ncbi:MAG: CPBP family intramembrane glutamic endopeptidase [Spirochaetota bacterium]
MKRFVLFTLLTFTISWALWTPVIAVGLHTTETPAGAILFLLGGFGPSVAGAIFIVRGGGGRELASRIFSPRRNGLLEISVALLAYPAVFAVSVGASRLFGAEAPGFAGLAGMLGSPGAFIGNVVLVVLLGPLSEEVGWRGFALEEAQTRYSPIPASLLLGVVWWAWHLPLFFMEGTLHESQGLLSAFTAGYLFTVLGYSGLFTWLYNRSKRSILVAIAAHFSVNMTIAVASPFEGSVFAIAAVLLLLGAGGIFLTDRGATSTAHQSRHTPTG